MSDLTYYLTSRFHEAHSRADERHIENVKSGNVAAETDSVPQKPPLPDLNGKVMLVYYKDPEAISNAVSDFVDGLLAKVKNGYLIRDEVYRLVYSKIKGIGEDITVGVNLDTGMKKVVE